MPSLRRSASSPAIRASPYSVPVVQQQQQQQQQQQSPLRPSQTLKRRSSTVAQPGRVVLAEIEWWRVMRGQEPEVEEHDEEGAQPDDAPGDSSSDQELIASAVSRAISSAAHPADSFTEAVLDNESLPATSATATEPARYFASLTLSPSTPGPSEPASPTSSFASSPVSSPPSSPIASRLRVKRPSRPIARHRSSSSLAPLFGLCRPAHGFRSVSFGGFDLEDAFLPDDVTLEDILAELPDGSAYGHGKASSEPGMGGLISLDSPPPSPVFSRVPRVSPVERGHA